MDTQKEMILWLFLQTYTEELFPQSIEDFMIVECVNGAELTSVLLVFLMYETMLNTLVR